jgi:hypothetical protein
MAFSTKSGAFLPTSEGAAAREDATGDDTPHKALNIRLRPSNTLRMR